MDNQAGRSTPGAKGSPLARARREAGLTQKEFVERLGISLWKVERLEEGSEDPGPYLELLEKQDKAGGERSEEPEVVSRPSEVAENQGIEDVEEEDVKEVEVVADEDVADLEVEDAKVEDAEDENVAEVEDEAPIRAEIPQRPERSGVGGSRTGNDPAAAFPQLRQFAAALERNRQRRAGD